MRTSGSITRRRILFWSLALAAVTLLVVWILAHGDAALRRTARVTIEEQLTALLQGEIHFDRVEKLSWGSVQISGVVVRDPQKRVVLRAQSLDVDFDLLALWRGKVLLTRARMTGAKVRLYPSSEAVVSLFDSFVPKPGADPDAPSEGSPVSVHFENVTLVEAEITGDVPGLSGLHAYNVSARARLDVTDSLSVRVYAVQGVIDRPYAVPVTLASGVLSLTTEPMAITGSFRIEHDNERLHARLGYTGLDDSISLLLHLDPLSTDTLRALELGAPETLLGDLRGTVKLESVRDAWKFRAALTSAGGPIHIIGSQRQRGETRVHLSSESMDLGQLFAYVPSVRLGATVNAVADAQGNVHLEAVSPGVEAFGIAVQEVRASGDYKAGILTITHAGFAYAGGDFDITGYIEDDADLSLRVKSVIPEISRERALREQGLQARVTTDLTITHQEDLLAVEGRATLQGFAYGSLTADHLSLQGRASGDIYKPDLRVTAHGKGVAVSGYPLGDTKIVATGRNGIYRTNLSVSDARGRAAHATVRFEDRPDSLRIIANPLTVSVPGHEPWRAEADVVIDSDGVELRRVTLKNGPQLLDANGRFSYSRAYRIDGKVVQFDLGGLRELSGLDLADLDGTIDGTLALTGVPNHPRIDAHATLKNGQFLGMQGLDASLKLVSVAGRFDAQGEIILPDKSRLALSAGGIPGPGRSWVDEIANGTYQFALDFERVPFAVSRPWLAWLNLEPPGGTLSATVRGEGKLSAPALEATLRVDDLVVGVWPALDIDLSLTHDAEILTVRKLAVADERGEIGHAEGTLNASLEELLDIQGLRRSLDKRPFQVALSWPWRRVDELPGDLRFDLPLITAGSFVAHQSDAGPTMALNVRGTFPRGAAGVDACGTERFPDLTLVMRAKGQEASLKLSAVLGGQPLLQASASSEVPVSDWVTGRVPITKPRTSGELSARTDAAEDLPLLCQVMLGPINVKAAVRDVFADPPDVSFEIQSPALQLVPNRSQGHRLGELRRMKTAGRPFALNVRGGVEQDRVSLVGHVDGGPSSTLDFFASAPRAAFAPKQEGRDLEPIEARVRMKNLDLARLLVALPIGVRAGGVMNGDARISYDLDDDSLGLEGQIALTKGVLSVPALGQELSDLTAMLALQGNRVIIKRFSARDFDGKFSADGEIRFDTLSHALIELNMGLRDFPVRREGAEVSKLTGDMVLRADVDEERMRAELTIGDLRIDLPNELGQGLQDLGLHPNIIVVGEERKQASPNPYVFEVRVIARRPPFRIRRTGLSAEVLADLTVRYSEPLLTIQGSAELKRGSFELYGKRFELEESRLSFNGQDQLDPLVSLAATHRIGSDEITVRLDGRLSAPTVTFTHSDPSITDTGEIIAQLLGGRSSENTRTDQDATGAAANFLAGATAGLLTEEVRQEFGGAIPVLAIESGDQAFRNTRIRAGVQLDRLIEKRLGRLRNVVRGAYVEGFVAPGADPDSPTQNIAPQSRGGGLIELRFPADFLGSIEYRPIQSWRIDVAWEP